MKIRWGTAVAVLAWLWAGAAGADCTGDQGKARQVEQKLALLARLLEDSEPLRRAQQSGDAEALAKVEGARASLDGARRALDDGCIDQASALSAQGYKLVTTAFRSAPKRNGRARAAYEAALQQATSFLLSLESQPVEERGISADDLVGIERQIERAETLASNGGFAQAVRLLAPVNDRLQRRLTAILDNKTIYYEKSFATRADEYAYFKEQYDGYLLLLQSGQKTAAYSARQRVDSLLASAAAQYDSAEASAAQADWDNAISTMRKAVNDCELAVRATGYSY